MIENDGHEELDVQELDLHICTEEDFNSFYPPSKTTVDKFELLRNDNSMLCLNQTDSNGDPVDLRIWGKNEVEHHRRLDISFMPCKPVFTTDESIPCRISENTIDAYKEKLLEIKEKIKSPDLRILMNREKI
jgi:hypothetical protein